MQYYYTRRVLSLEKASEIIYRTTPLIGTKTNDEQRGINAYLKQPPIFESKGFFCTVSASVSAYAFTSAFVARRCGDGEMVGERDEVVGSG